MNNDLISREALKKYARVVFDKDLGRLRVVDVSDIDNAPTVTIPNYDERPQGEITNEDIQQAIKEGFANGYEMAKEKIIHSIAKQYSEHNALVPIWLSIGDIKGGAEE